MKFTSFIYFSIVKSFQTPEGYGLPLAFWKVLDSNLLKN